MKFIYSDGGRSRYFKGKAGDCVCRAICNATDCDYKLVYDLIADMAKTERTGTRKRGKSSPRNGVYKGTIRKVCSFLGLGWVPAMAIGSGCQTHLNPSELPKRAVVSVSKHETCVRDGAILDTFDPSRDGGRCVYGWYEVPEGFDAKEAERRIAERLAKGK